ncbi:hypothetical protein AMATHDRAFT_11437 [Amanita thiersii Skay4041]|uniref:Protein kinase domain-containing protein n=1 Tax=Amanita thiersii Skay4041 TaxID=703135 RepID=A0A2A9N911_9AGAR|nr:hypothetical protein AMATHDRAFT_11437 [Amanita thiersii Skay4041]
MSFRSKKELLQILADLVQVHKKLTEKELLHRDINIKNLMMTCDGPNYRGLLIDFDYMAIMSELLKDTQAGTIPFMSADALDGRKPHKPADDLESFFYVLIFICLEYSGPGHERNWDHSRDIVWDIYKTRPNCWLLGDDFTSLAAAKSHTMAKAERFQEDVLDELPPYFKELSPCLMSLWRALFRSDEAITHNIFTAVSRGQQQQHAAAS